VAGRSTRSLGGKSMQDREWHTFFATAVRVLGAGEVVLADTPSWCAWTTFTRLAEDSGYWTRGLPRQDDIRSTHIADGGVWGQSFPFAELAHVIIPREFSWEAQAPVPWKRGTRQQDIATLSSELTRAGIVHRATSLVLEIKCY
jgi:hypothetical protein